MLYTSEHINLFAFTPLLNAFTYKFVKVGVLAKLIVIELTVGLIEILELIDDNVTLVNILLASVPTSLIAVNPTS